MSLDSKGAFGADYHTNMSGARSRTEDFSRKVAKAVLSPREDIDVAIGTGDHGEGGSEVKEADVYEVVDRYKQELEEIISNLKPQGKGGCGVQEARKTCLGRRGGRKGGGRGRPRGVPEGPGR